MAASRERVQVELVAAAFHADPDLDGAAYFRRKAREERKRATRTPSPDVLKPKDSLVRQPPTAQIANEKRTAALTSVLPISRKVGSPEGNQRGPKWWDAPGSIGDREF